MQGKPLVLLLSVLYGSAFIAGFNENLVNMALVSIMAEYGVDSVTAQWLVTGYMIVATVAVLLDMDPDDLNNVGAMRNAFWTRMTPHTDPRNADRPTWKLEEFNQGPAIASFADWENGPESLRAPGMPLWKPIIQ